MVKSNQINYKLKELIQVALQLKKIHTQIHCQFQIKSIKFLWINNLLRQI